MSSKLVAGKESINQFCLSVFSIQDPVICVWCSETPPNYQSSYEPRVDPDPDDKQPHIDDVKLYLKEQIDSMFFPEGFILDKWNKVLIGVKNTEQIISGWMMGTDINKFAITDDFLIKAP